MRASSTGKHRGALLYEMRHPFPHEDAAHGSLSLEASRNVHSIAIEIVSLYDQIPQMDSDAEHHAVEFALVPVRVRDRLPLVCAAGVPKGLPFAYRAGQSPIQSNRKSSSLAAQRGVRPNRPMEHAAPHLFTRCARTAAFAGTTGTRALFLAAVD
jgi:hypothetical protein